MKLRGIFCSRKNFFFYTTHLNLYLTICTNILSNLYEIRERLQSFAASYNHKQNATVINDIKQKILSNFCHFMLLSGQTRDWFPTFFFRKAQIKVMQQLCYGLENSFFIMLGLSLDAGLSEMTWKKGFCPHPNTPQLNWVQWERGEWG